MNIFNTYVTQQYRPKITALIIVLMFIGVVPNDVLAKQLSVTEDKGESLQEIIDNAPAGATITLEAGEYKGPITISQSLHLTANPEDKVTIVNESLETALTITAPYTTIENIVVKELEKKDESALLIRADGVEINNVQVLTDNNGIHINEAYDGKISHVTVASASETKGRPYKKNGIEIYNAARWEVDTVNISNMEDGVYLERVDDITIKNSYVEGSRYGFHLMFVTNGQVVDNVGTANVTGAMIMASSSIQVKDNTFLKQVENLNSQGILLYDTQASSVQGNTIDGNRVGLYIEQSSDVTFENNSIKNNFVGLQWINSSSNTFQSNNVIGNVINVQSVGVSDNNINKNYWDNASGIDINNDRYSEVSYSINPLFYGLIKKQPPFQIFFNSPGMSFLESIYISNPELWMKDKEPLMEIEVTEDMLSSSSSKFDSIFISAILLLIAFITINRTRRKLT